MAISNFAPAEDLVNQVGQYLEQFEESVESEAYYNDSKGKLAKDSNTLIVIALALGLHDVDNRYKAAAETLMKSAQQLAAAEDYAAAKAAVVAVRAAVASSEGDPSALEWGKVASLKELMGAVPAINKRLQGNLRGSEFEPQADKTAGDSAVLAVIAQGSMANGGETQKPDEIEEWHAQSIQMRDAAAAVNAAIHAKDQIAAEAAMGKLNQSCKDCHVVFRPKRGRRGPGRRFRGPNQ